MKKLFLGILISAAFIACGDSNNTTETNTGTNTTTEAGEKSGDNINNMPGTIRTAFQNRYTNAVVEKWERETENNQEVYEVEFKQNDKEMKAYFDASGNFIREEND